MGNPTVKQAFEYIKANKFSITPEYLSNALLLPQLEVWFDVEYCTKSCDICYGNYGPHRTPLKPDVVEKVMESINETDIGMIWLGNGEPFHDFNILGNMLHQMRGFPVGIDTNGYFATTYDDALRGLEFIKNHGYHVRPQKHRSLDSIVCSRIGVSADPSHGEESYGDAINLGNAYLDVFSDELEKDHINDQVFVIAYTSDNDGTLKSLKSDFVFFERLIIPLDDSRDWYETGSKKDLDSKPAFAYFTENGALLVSPTYIMPWGRGKVKLGWEKELIKTTEIGLKSEELPSVSVRPNGNVYMGHGQCIVEGRVVGNVFNSKFSEIIDDVSKDPFWQMYQAFELRGVLEAIKLTGGPTEFLSESECNVCIDVFSDREKINHYRNRFNKMVGGRNMVDFIMELGLENNSR